MCSLIPFHSRYATIAIWSQDSKKERSLVQMLQFIQVVSTACVCRASVLMSSYASVLLLRQCPQGSVWKALFNKNADGLEKSNDKEDECTWDSFNFNLFINYKILLVLL